MTEPRMVMTAMPMTSTVSARNSLRSITTP